MKVGAKQQVQRWAWVWIPALILGLVLVAPQGPLTLSAQIQPDERADPSGFQARILDKNAVASAVEFREYPIVWLGEEFRGYRLTSVAWEQYALPGTAIVVDRVNLVYGSCDRAQDESTCTPPLAIVVFAPGSIPAPSNIVEEAKAAAGSKRGLATADVSGSTILWADGGVSIQVQSNGDLRTEIVDSLRLANAAVFGIDEISSRESLAPLKGVKGPASPSVPTATTVPAVTSTATPTTPPARTP